MSEKFGIPTAVTNDANAAALGEMTYGSRPRPQGLYNDNPRHRRGFRIVVNGQVVYGHDGLAGELGHT